EVNLTKPGSLRAVEVLDSKASELLQLSDLYLGLLRFGYEWGWPVRRGTAGMPAGETRKQRFYREFAELVESTRQKSRLQVWEWRPPAPAD
ncbi:MAG: hypothetical protein HYU66_02440, partial [Armatimonadetes bacterium]|nr:hypothetical protein [Armatimonadota bacterium]